MAVKPYAIEEDKIEVPRFEEAGVFYTTKQRSKTMAKLRVKNSVHELLKKYQVSDPFTTLRLQCCAYIQILFDNRQHQSRHKNALANFGKKIRAFFGLQLPGDFGPIGVMQPHP